LHLPFKKAKKPKKSWTVYLLKHPDDKVPFFCSGIMAYSEKQAILLAAKVNRIRKYSLKASFAKQQDSQN